MAWELWRGSECLGALHPHGDAEPGQISAILLVHEDAGELEGVMQSRIDILPDRPVMEHALEPVVDVGGRRPVSPRASGRQVAPLRPMTEAERRGVPEARRLGVRDGAGRPVGARLVMLREFRPAPEHRGRVLEGLPAAALHRGGLWLVLVSLDS